MNNDFYGWRYNDWLEYFWKEDISKGTCVIYKTLSEKESASKKIINVRDLFDLADAIYKITGNFIVHNLKNKDLEDDIKKQLNNQSNSSSKVYRVEGICEDGRKFFWEDPMYEEYEKDIYKDYIAYRDDILEES